MNLSRLLVIHAVVTFIAGMVLMLKPQAIPGTLSLSVDKSSYLLCYLLGAAEITLAYLSFFSRKLTNPESLRLVAVTFIVFHVVTAGVEVAAYVQGVTAAIWINIGFRIFVSLLFLYYGLIKPSQRNKTKGVLRLSKGDT